MEAKIIKKEDKLTYKGGFLKNKNGSLVLTNEELYFLSKNKRIFSIPIKNIISLRSALGIGNGVDHLFITYLDQNKEKIVKIQHFSFFTGAGLGIASRLRTPYFTTWEQTIEKIRSQN